MHVVGTWGTARSSVMHKVSVPANFPCGEDSVYDHSAFGGRLSDLFVCFQQYISSLPFEHSVYHLFPQEIVSVVKSTGRLFTGDQVTIK